MTLVLLVIGLLATAAGLLAIGFGIPINAFSLGNTLIIAGTVAASAGMILIGLAAAIGQLRRIADGLPARSMTRARGAESVEPILPPTARLTPATPPPPPSHPIPTRMPPPPRPPEMREPPPMPEAHHPEPRFPATAPGEPPGPLDWLRAKPRSGPAAAPASVPDHMAMPAEPPMVEDEAPLSPRAPQRPAMPSEPAFEAEPKVWTPSRSNGVADARPSPSPMPRANPQPQLPPEPPRERIGFDMLWPEPSSPPPMPEPAKREAAPEMPPREGRMPEKRAEAPPPKPAERGPAILKSGVIDGMPYTLYADGSIEAELPQGVVKFASVDALRAHLEKHG